jgi:predicted  nucleic acid-binding Zn-ribbon protein
MTYNNHYQHDLYRTKIAGLIAKNINLRRDVDTLLMREHAIAEELRAYKIELNSAYELNRSLSASLARLVNEKYKLELELEAIGKD